MKQRDLVRHLRRHRCVLFPHGGSHDVWLNPVARMESAVPRHREIVIGTARAISKQLRIPSPPQRG